MRRAGAVALCAAALLAPGVARAAGPTSTQSMSERLEAFEALWRPGVAVGVSTGAGSPLGLVGVFAEMSPVTWVSVGWGGGYGAFGPALAGQLVLRPTHIEDWAPALLVGMSGNFTPDRYLAQGDMVVPAVSRWFNVGYATEWRTTMGRVLRLGLGHTFMLGPSAFRCREGAVGGGICSAASEDENPGWTPFALGSMNPGKAAVTTSLGGTTHFWFVHLDLGALFLW